MKNKCKYCKDLVTNDNYWLKDVCKDCGQEILGGYFKWFPNHTKVFKDKYGNSHSIKDTSLENYYLKFESRYGDDRWLCKSPNKNEKYFYAKEFEKDDYELVVMKKEEAKELLPKLKDFDNGTWVILDY